MHAPAGAEGWVAASAFACFAAAFASSLCARTSAAARKTATFLFTCGAAAAVAAAAMHAAAGKSAPLKNIKEFMLSGAAALPLFTLYSAKKLKCRTVGADSFLAAALLFPCAFVFTFKTRMLPPALQSPLFVPHVASYLTGYLILLRAALPGTGPRARDTAGAGFFCLTLGLTLGALWGEICWGDWWQFDPKEMWSLATWFFYAAYMAARGKLAKHPRLDAAALAAGAVLIILTMTWVNFSRIFQGHHTAAM